MPDNDFEMPRKVSVETSAFCNRKCPWCPQHDLPREQHLLPMELFEKVVRELAEVGYDSSFGLHLFNEPLFDERLVDLVRIAKEGLPRASIYFHSNGDILTVSKFRELLAAGLSGCHVNQYDENATAKILAVRDGLTESERTHMKLHRFMKRNIFNRAGLVQTARQVPLSRQCRRARQLCVNYKGDVILCCCDYLGQVCAGNVRDANCIDLFNDPVFKDYRAKLKFGQRAGLKLCEKCDLFG